MAKLAGLCRRGECLFRFGNTNGMTPVAFEQRAE
jgi:hypothetical protein